MTRITKERLNSRVGTLNMLLDRPMTRFSDGASVSQQNVGHLTLDKNSDGYKLVELVTGTGCETHWSPRLSAPDMDMFINGIINGISLRNAHIGAILLKAKVEEAGLTSDAALYSDASVVLLQSAKSSV